MNGRRRLMEALESNLHPSFSDIITKAELAICVPNNYDNGQSKRVVERLLTYAKNNIGHGLKKGNHMF